MFTGPRAAMVPWFTQCLDPLIEQQLQLLSKQREHGDSPFASGKQHPHKPAQAAPAGPAAGRVQAQQQQQGHMAHRLERSCRPSGGGPGSSGSDEALARDGQQHAGGLAGVGAADCSSEPFAYIPEVHGVASDWVMDLVSVGFGKEQVRCPCLTLGVVMMGQWRWSE